MIPQQFKRPALIGLIAGFLALGSMLPAVASAAEAHPYYVHGLQDLRAAHHFIDQHSYANVQRSEAAADRDISRAYHYAVIAAEADQKDLNTYEPVDANLHHRDRLVRALSALEAAHHDFSQYESYRPARGWQHDTVRWVDYAISHVKQALREQHWDRNFTDRNY